MSEKITPIDTSGLRFEVLSREDVQRMHQTTLDIIESVGIYFPSKKALEIWESVGAKVDHESMIVRIPGHVIEDALAKAPPTYTLCARENPALDLPLDGKHAYLSIDGTGIEVLDIETGKIRDSTKQDVANAARFGDAMDQIALMWPPVSALDAPAGIRALHELDAIWNNWSKHVQTECVVTEHEMRAAIEMAAALAGGREELRKRPLLSIMQCTISPLGQDKGSIDASLLAAEAGLPVGFMTMASCGFNGPASLAGNLVVGNAEVVSALALFQIAYPGCPVYYAAAQTAMDPRTGAYTGGGPEDYLFGNATNQLSDFYNVPLSMGAFATGAKRPDWQAAFDNVFASFMASLSGADILQGVGMLYGSRIFSFEQLLMDCEIYDAVSRVQKGIPVNDDTLALDVIKEIGAGQGKNYIAHKHTRKHIRDIWIPNYIDRRPYSSWEKDGKGALEFAHERARSILETYQPAPLDPKLSEEFRRIIASTEAELKG